jgi:DNA-binding NarL/FixJ family response regulator
VPAGIDLSAYRIVQEALTNVLKHAGAARAQVVIAYGDKEITVEVTDDGRSAVPKAAVDDLLGTGHGLIGVRERVSSLDETAGARILILTTFDLDQYVYEALRAGASGFVLEDIPRPNCSPRSGSSPPATRCSPRA